MSLSQKFLHRFITYLIFCNICFLLVLLDLLKYHNEQKGILLNNTKFHSVVISNWHARILSFQK